MGLVNVKQGRNVLVVYDCEDNLLLMKLLLQGEGYKVKSADSGRKGLAEISKQCPDLIVLDLMMPDISGLEVIQHLKDKYCTSNIPIILLTANSNIQHQDVKYADAVCYKPFDIYTILRKIKSLLAVPIST